MEVRKISDGKFVVISCIKNICRVDAVKHRAGLNLSTSLFYVSRKCFTMLDTFAPNHRFFRYHLGFSDEKLHFGKTSLFVAKCNNSTLHKFFKITTNFPSDIFRTSKNYNSINKNDLQNKTLDHFSHKDLTTIISILVFSGPQRQRCKLKTF